MPTKLRLLGVDSVNRVAAMEVGIIDHPPATALNTAINALGAATYGSVDGSAPKPSQLVYAGYELVYSLSTNPTPNNGDVRDVWTVKGNSLSLPSFSFQIPGRETDDPSLLVAGSLILANFSAAPWVAWLAAMADAQLGAPILRDGSSGLMAGAISNTTRRQRPRVGIRT